MAAAASFCASRWLIGQLTLQISVLSSASFIHFFGFSFVNCPVPDATQLYFEPILRAVLSF